MLKILFYLSVAALSLGQFSGIAKFGDTKLYVFDVLVVAFSIIGTMYFLIKDGKYKIGRYLIPFYIFCLFGVVSMVYNGNFLSSGEFLIAVLYLFRLFFYITAANVVYNLLLNKTFNLKNIADTFIISGLFVAVAGFVQLVVLPDFTVLDPVLGWDPHRNRLASTFFDPNYVGAYFVLVLTFVVFKDKFYSKREIINRSRFLTLSFITILIALFLTYSRSSWGMFGAVVMIYGFFRSRWLILLAIFIAFSTYFAIPRIQTRLAGITDPADSAHFRLISWSNTLDIAKDHLLLGVGYNAFKKAQIDYGYLTPDTVKEHSAAGSDSSLLLVLATTGVLGLTLFSYGLINPIIKSRSIYSIVLIIPLLLGSNFVNSIFYPQIMFLWLVVVIAMEMFKI